MRKITVLILLIMAACAGSCLAQLPSVKRYPWDDEARAAIARVDRRVLDDDSNRYRPFVDNRDRVHLNIRFIPNGDRLISLAVPASWGEDRAVNCGTECARKLGWPLQRRGVADTGESILVSIEAARHTTMRWNETIPWPELFALLKSAGAERVEIRLRSSGLPLNSPDGLDGWEDAGNGAMEMRVRVCEIARPLPAMRLTVGFSKQFIVSRIVGGLATIAMALGVMLLLYRAALGHVRRGMPGAVYEKVISAVAYGFAAVWLAEVMLGRMLFLVTLLHLSPITTLFLRFSCLLGPTAIIYYYGALLRGRLQRAAGIPEYPQIVVFWLLLLFILPASVALAFYLIRANHGSTASLLIHERGFVRWLAPIFLVLNGLIWTFIRMVRGKPQTVVNGELLDRGKELAARADLSLAVMQVIDSRLATTNGMAAAGGKIMITKRALQLLPKCLIDAMLAHEVAHLKLGHPIKRLNTLLPGTFVFGLIGVGALLTGHIAVFLIAIACSPLSIVICSPRMRRQEFEADALGAELTRDPRGMIRLIAALTFANKGKLTPPRIEQAISTHPSPMQRMKTLADRFGIPLGEVDRLIAEEQAQSATASPIFTNDRYDFPGRDSDGAVPYGISTRW